MGIAEDLDRVAEESWGGDVGKQADLVNLPFTLLSAELKHFDEKTDESGKVLEEARESYIATILLDGETEPQDFWMGGKLVMPQMRFLLNGELPVKLKLVRDASKTGSPFKLQFVSAVEAAPSVQVGPNKTLPQKLAEAQDAVGMDAVLVALEKVEGATAGVQLNEDGSRLLMLGDVPINVQAKIVRALGAL